MRWFLPFAFIVGIVFGGAYAAGFIYRIMGPDEAIALYQDGTLSHMQFGSDLPRPEWVPVYPSAMIVQGSRIVSAHAPSGFHGLELAVRASLDDVKQFYTERLHGCGLRGGGPRHALAQPDDRGLLGIAGALSAKRIATDDQIDIQIRTADGLIPSRMLQISWRKMSEMPGAVAQANERSLIRKRAPHSARARSALEERRSNKPSVAAVWSISDCW